MEKSDGSFFAPGDFVVGDNVSFYGRTYHLVDADAFTRQAMAEAGLEYGPAEAYPDDPFTTKRLSTQRHGFGRSSTLTSHRCGYHECYCYCCSGNAVFPMSCIPLLHIHGRLLQQWLHSPPKLFCLHLHTHTCMPKVSMRQSFWRWNAKCSVSRTRFRLYVSSDFCVHAVFNV